MAEKWKNILFLFSVLTLIVLALGAHLHDTITPTQGVPWPYPKAYRTTDFVNTIDAASFRFNIVGSDCDILRDAAVRYQKAIFGNLLSSKEKYLKFVPRSERKWLQTRLSQLAVSVTAPCEEQYPSLESDETCMYIVISLSSALYCKGRIC